MARLGFLYSIALMYQWHVSADNSAVRKKRVVHGRPVLDMNSEYKVLTYYVVIMRAHLCDIVDFQAARKLFEIEKQGGAFTVTIPFTACTPRTDAVICGGSLLTPTVVQTACHCVCTYCGHQEEMMWAVSINTWERMLDVFPGGQRVGHTRGVKARHYLHHPKCGRFTERGPVLHDYALIVLRKKLLQRGLGVAPIYTIFTLTKLWTDIMAKHAVCLIVGYGRFRLSKSNVTLKRKPSQLLHAWVRIMDFETCYRKVIRHLPKSANNMVYRDYATWFCIDSLPTWGGRQGQGDSGGPVTCNNHYAGLVHRTYTNAIRDWENFRFKSINWFNTAMSTAFSIFENSAEYRQAMLFLLHLTDAFDPRAAVFNYRPTSAEIIEYVGKIPNFGTNFSTVNRTFLVWILAFAQITLYLIQ